MARKFLFVKGAISRGVKTALLDFPPAPEDTSDIYSYLGQPVFGSLEIKGGTYEELDGTVVTYNGLLIKNCITTVDHTKNIVRTQVNGRRGSVKEYINDLDYSITFEIEISTGDNRYPVEDVATFINICQVPVRLEVVNELLQLYGINFIVVENDVAGQERGYRARQKFTLRALSDFDDIIEE